MYAHLDKVLVNVGDSIKQKDVIALSGNSGLSTGPHLHYSIWYNDETVDPIKFVNY
jgi:murein DD-endopeptidase MepM/ murein hydrolase activator NlpD